MSSQHAQVLNMVMKKAETFAASLGIEMILDEGVSFDPRLHEAVENRSPGSDSLDVLELVQPGYLQNGNGPPACQGGRLRSGRPNHF